MKIVMLLFALLFLVACGAQDAINATKSMPGEMEQMRAKMGETERALGRLESYKGLTNEENGRVLSPVPFGLMGYAREFAKYASTVELAEITYLWIKEINEVSIDDILPSPTPEDIFKFDHRKQHTQASLQAVAGFISRDKLNTILREQIYSSGRYADATLNLLMLRVRFLRDVMLKASLLSEDFDEVGMLIKAIEHAEEIEYIARQRFALHIYLDLTGFKNNDLDIHDVFDPREALKIWQDIKRKADTGLKVKYKDVASSPVENEKLFVENKARYSQAMSLVDQRIRAWGAQP